MVFREPNSNGVSENSGTLLGVLIMKGILLSGDLYCGSPIFATSNTHKHIRTIWALSKVERRSRQAGTDSRCMDRDFSGSGFQRFRVSV